MRDASRKRLRPIQEVALSVGAILGLLCVIASLSAVVFGVTPLVFRSGSMVPAIDTGALALAETVPAAELAVGDIVSVDLEDGTKITHRVADIVTVVGNSAELVLKGDANDVVDPETYVVAEAQRVFADVPYAGYFVSWLSTPLAWGTGALLSVSLLVVAWRPTDRERREPTHSSGMHAVMASVSLVAVTATVIGVGVSRGEMTLAASTDIAYAGTSVTAGTLARPGVISCTTTGTIVTDAVLTWPNNEAYGYELAYRALFLGPSGQVPLAPVSGTTRTYRVSQMAQLLSAGQFELTLRSKVGNFVSVGSRIIRINVLLGLTSSCGSATSTNAGAAARSGPAQMPETEPTQISTSTIVEPEPMTTVVPPTTTESTPAPLPEAPAPTSTTTTPSTTTPPSPPVTTTTT
ncbi:signal peptidase I, partial [Rhodococcus fascians]|nr:signal peptidase I [Rhodococcus fascians]